MTGEAAPQSDPPSRRRGARDAVERAARELFVQNGYSGTSIDEIARRAGVSKPTIYAHFGDKAGLFTHILEAACTRLLKPIVDTAADTRPVGEVLRDFAFAYTRTVLSPQVLALHRLFIGEAERFPELGQKYYASGPQAVHAELAAFLRRRAASGEIRCADPDMMASQFAAVVLTPMRLKLLFAVADQPDWTEVDRFSESAVRMFTKTLEAAGG